MKRNRWYARSLVALAGVFALALSSCQKEPEMMAKEEMAEAVATRAGAQAYASFATLPDPYSLENMQEVYNVCGMNATLEATDLYVRFRPQDIEQLAVLEETYNLDLFDYPLDLDIPDGVEYVDPAIPEGDPIWYYTTVKPNFVFPEEIPFEIIRSCYIPADDEMLQPPGTRAGESEMAAVELLAFQRLGYEVESDTRSGGGGGVRPVGYVKVWNNTNSSWEPLRGVRVKVNSYTKIDLNAYTNEEGYYQASKRFWDKNVKYTVVFHNRTNDFWIWEGLGNRAKYKHGRYSKYGCNIDMSNTTNGWQWAVVNNAAWDYYAMCRLEGITKPPSDLKIWVQQNKGTSSATMLRRVNITGTASELIQMAFLQAVLGVLEFVADVLGLVPDLTIGTQNADFRRIYEAVNHELSHASHFSVVGGSYWSGYIRHIAQNYLDGNRNATYGYNTGQYAGNCEIGEMWGYAMGYLQRSEKFNQEWLDEPYNAHFYGAGGVNSSYADDWIHPDPIWALITKNILSKKQIFDCLTADVDTRAKLIAKLRGKYPEKAGYIDMAFATNDAVEMSVISGPDTPKEDAYVAYNVTLPEGDVEFNGWTVTGGSYSTVGGLNSQNLNIQFTTAAQYNLTAKFTLTADGEEYDFRISKVIVSRPLLNSLKIYVNTSNHYQCGLEMVQGLFDVRIINQQNVDVYHLTDTLARKSYGDLVWITPDISYIDMVPDYATGYGDPIEWGSLIHSDGEGSIGLPCPQIPEGKYRVIITLGGEFYKEIDFPRNSSNVFVRLYYTQNGELQEDNGFVRCTGNCNF